MLSNLILQEMNIIESAQSKRFASFSATDFNNWKNTVFASERLKTQILKVKTHTNVAHTNTLANHSDNHSDNGAYHSNSAHSNNHSDYTYTTVTEGHNQAFAYYGQSVFSHRNVSPHGQSKYSQSGYSQSGDSYYSPHSDNGGHSNYNPHANVAHSNVGFDHQNYVPSAPAFFNLDATLKDTVTIGFVSFDQNNDGVGTQDALSKTVKYKIEIRKIKNLDGSANVGAWTTLQDFSAIDNFSLNTKLYTEGTYELRATAQNDSITANSVTETYVSPSIVKTVLIRQNSDLALEVTNGSEFIGFTFGENGAQKTGLFKDYDTLYSTAPTNADQGLFVSVRTTDIDTGQYHKGTALLKDSAGNIIAGSTVNVIWSNGSNIIQTNGGAQTGYVYFPKEMFTTLDRTGVKVEITVSDYLDAGATTLAGSTILRQTISSTDTTTLTFNVDKTAPTTPVIVADKTTPTNANVLTAITYSADSAIKEYRVNGGAWTTYTTPVAFASNGTIEARSKDATGNISATALYSVTNIDKVVPVITVAPYTTTPINTDIVVTASTNEGTLNVTSKTFTTNGSFDFIATDSAGNVTTKTVTITNIDKTAPITPVIVANKTTPTNTDVTTAITYSSDSIETEYRVNGGAWTAYTAPITFSDNGTIEARSKDDAGNWSTVANYEVTNIDKIAPTVPTMSIVDSNVLTIVSGTDAEFGVNHVEYRLNGGTWTVYDSAVELVDGDYSVESRTLDNAGNYSDITSEDYVIYKSRLADAVEAVSQAEASVTQVAVDTARDKVALLPFTTPEKVTLTLRLDVVQAKVDNNALIFELDLMKHLLLNRQADDRLPEFTARLAEMKVEVSELTLLTNTSVTTTKINQVEKVIKYIESFIVAEDALKPVVDSGDIGDIGDPAIEEALQQQITEANNVALAVQAVEKAEVTKLALDIASAWTAIKIISTEPIKGQLIVRMNVVDHVYVKAEKAVTNAEKYRTSTYINTAINQVKLVANDNPRKETIITRLEIVRLEYNRAVILKDTAKLKRDAIYYVEQAESFGTVFYNAKAQFYVDLLDGIDEVLQAELQARLDVTKGLLATASAISHTVRMATKYVETAETYKTPELIATAQGYVNLITNENTAKAELQARLDAIQQ